MKWTARAVVGFDACPALDLAGGKRELDRKFRDISIVKLRALDDSRI